MGIGLSGMISGLDTDSIVQAMVSAQRTKATKIENKITLNKWTTEAWSSLNTKIYSFYTKYASKLRLQSSYMTRTAKSSNEDVVTATASSTAALGTHSLQIKQLASSQYVTGGQLKTTDENGVEQKANYSKTTKLTEMGMTAGSAINISGTEDVTFTVEEGSTINDFITACKNAGLNANFDTTQQRFFISSSESGSENAFSISVEGAPILGNVEEVEKRVATEYLSEEELATYNSALSTIKNAVTAGNENLVDLAVAAVNEDDFDVESASELEKAVYNLKELAVDSRAEKLADSMVDAVDTTGLSEEEIATAEAERAAKVAELTERIKNPDVEITDSVFTDDELAALETDIADANTTVTNVETNILRHIGNVSVTGTESADLSALGLGTIDASDASASNGTNGMSVVAASDAVFVLDGAEMTETSNNFTVNGITLNLANTTYNKDTQEYDSVQITIGKDADSTYKLVKEALTEYNTLIEEMNTLYSADSARGYDPLTDEQKEAMSEEEIKNWEDKIKSSLLRRDDTLGSLLSSMRSALSTSYTDEDGKVYSLSTYGIVTGTYTENGKLHIYGDEDDATYATYTDRLKSALEEDPDQVMEVLTNVFGKLYDTMTEKCAKTEISSALTFYNDKQYKNLLEDYEDDLDLMEDRIADLEDRYYEQFTAMETALSKLQSQSNSLASLLGTSTQ